MVRNEQLIVLKLEGDLEQQGFRVSLEIAKGDRPVLEVVAALPSDPELVTCLKQWQQAYRRLGVSSRIMPQEIIYGGSVNYLYDCRRSTDQLRDRFISWLKSSQFQRVDRQLRETLNMDEPVRILIWTQDCYLWRLPWHLWEFVDHYPQVEVALVPSTLEPLQVTKSTCANRKAHILAILGNRIGISVDKDRALLEQLTDAEVTFLVEPSRRQITQQLWDQHWDILFFAGHSQTEGNQGRIALNSEETLTLEELKYGLRSAITNGLQLAIFNSCDGLGLAQELKQLRLPQMVVMREPVPDLVAQEFLKHFLLAFVQGKSLYLAERHARERLQGLESEYPCASWLPIICQNSTSLPVTWHELVNRVGDAKVKNQRSKLSPLSPAPSASFRSLLPFSCFITALVVGLRFLGGLQPAELWAFDQLMQLRPEEGLDPRILIVKATEADFQQLKEDPLSDRTVTRLLQKLERYQPSGIGLDLYRDIPQGKGRQELLQYLQQNDRVIAACKIPDNNDSGIAPPPGLPQQHLGFTDVVVDPNQVIRRQLLSVSPKPAVPCSTGYALSFLLAARYLEARGYPSSITPDNDWQLGDVVFRRLQSPAGGYQKLETGGSQILLNYRTPIAVAQQVTVNQVLSDPHPGYIKNRIILIGVDSDNKDRYLTPYSQGQGNAQTVPGVMLHAQMVSQILSAVIDRRPLLWVWSSWVEILWIGGWSLLGGLLGLYLRSPLQFGLAGSATLFILGGVGFVVLLQGGWIPLVPAAIVLVTTGGSFIVYNISAEKHQAFTSTATEYSS